MLYFNQKFCNLCLMSSCWSPFVPASFSNIRKFYLMIQSLIISCCNTISLTYLYIIFTRCQKKYHDTDPQFGSQLKILSISGIDKTLVRKVSYRLKWYRTIILGTGVKIVVVLNELMSNTVACHQFSFKSNAGLLVSGMVMSEHI